MQDKEQEILTSLETDMKTLKEMLQETVNDIREEGFSKYPILIAHITDIGFADLIINKELYQSHFNFSASTLELMVEKGIVLEERKKDMEMKIKSSPNTVCVLLLHPELMKFIFSSLN